MVASGYYTYFKNREDDFFIKLKVKSVYPSTEDIVKYICQKYSLAEEKYGSYELESVMGLSPNTIIDKDFEYIDHELIQKVICALNAELMEASVETLTNALEDCNYTKGDKLVEALLMAKVLAEKIGGRAILELI